MGQTIRFQETLRRLAMIDENFVEDQAGLGLSPAGESTLDAKTAALLQLGASVTLGFPAVCLEWSAGRALAAGATEDEIADALLAIAPVAGLGRIVSAAPEVATALGYDITAALEEPDGEVDRDAIVRGESMQTSERPRQDWTVVLRRRPVRMVDGQPVGGYTDVFEIICCDCGDDPGLDYREISPELQRIRGRYTMAAGVTAYMEHVDQHPKP
jgi:4-carboxymuconolactone decarboxylase